MTLQFLISTLDDGINRAAELPLAPMSGISYLISWQHSLGGTRPTLPESLRRDDVIVVEMNGIGLSRNRNNCLRHASGDILLIADDDCRYTRQGIDNIIKVFNDNPNLDIATFMMESRHNNKTYPEHEFALAKPPKGYYVTSFEIAIRRTSLTRTGFPEFDERFGLGSKQFNCCEEELFIENAVKHGFDCRFFPIVAVRHDEPTTQLSRATSRATIAARGAYLWISPRYRRTALARVFILALRLHRQHGIPFRKALRHLLEGIALIRQQSK